MSSDDEEKSPVTLILYNGFESSKFSILTLWTYWIGNSWICVGSTGSDSSCLIDGVRVITKSIIILLLIMLVSTIASTIFGVGWASPAATLFGADDGSTIVGGWICGFDGSLAATWLAITTACLIASTEFVATIDGLFGWFGLYGTPASTGVGEGAVAVCGFAGLAADTAVAEGGVAGFARGAGWAWITTSPGWVPIACGLVGGSWLGSGNTLLITR